MGYLDDIIIYSRSEQEHLEHLEEIFIRLKAAGLKLKLEKCCFFKKHIQYLGHLISADGIQPLPEKLESIAKMPAPKNPKEVKQFLGLVGYYRKFVPRFADISRVLTHLTKKDVEFKWTPECEKCFQILKEFLKQAPILRYPNPQASYTLYMDASKYAYAGMLTQHNDGVDHPITYVSGLFRGSQLNWATLTKEAYAIYMSIKKLSFYIDTAKITVRSDHLPLKKFLEKNTMNSKVNNWAVELESQNITFEYIPGIKNTLADTLSRLIDIDENIRLQLEEEGKEFGYFPFEELPPAQTQMVETISTGGTGMLSIHHTDPIETNIEIQLLLKDEKVAKLQECDPHIRQLRKQWDNNNLDTTSYTIEGFHKFLKATIAKQLETRAEWDDLVWKATAAYNFFPTESSGVVPFFLMFGREAAVKDTLLESENPKYLGTDDGMINVGLMTKLYHVVAHNLNEARKARDGNKKSTKPKEQVVLRVGDKVLIRDHTSKAFQPKYKDFCIVGLLGKNQIEIKDNHGHITKVHRKDVKKRKSVNYTRKNS